MAFKYIGSWNGANRTMGGSVRYDVGHPITLGTNIGPTSRYRSPDDYLGASPNADQDAVTLTLFATDYPDIPATERFVQEHHYSVPQLPAGHQQPTRFFAAFHFPSVPTRTHPYIRVMINLAGDTWMLYPEDNFPSYCDLHLSCDISFGL